MILFAYSIFFIFPNFVLKIPGNISARYQKHSYWKRKKPHKNSFSVFGAEMIILWESVDI